MAVEGLCFGTQKGDFETLCESVVDSLNSAKKSLSSNCFLKIDLASDDRVSTTGSKFLTKVPI